MSRFLETRVKEIDIRVARLEELPARIDALTTEVSNLRTEMREEFVVVRAEMATQGDTRRQELAALGSQMRVLHEDVIARIALLHEGRQPPRRRRKPH